jgi:hypothetical protein
LWIHFGENVIDIWGVVDFCPYSSQSFIKCKTVWIVWRTVINSLILHKSTVYFMLLRILPNNFFSLTYCCQLVISRGILLASLSEELPLSLSFQEYRIQNWSEIWIADDELTNFHAMIYTLKWHLQIIWTSTHIIFYWTRRDFMIAYEFGPIKAKPTGCCGDSLLIDASKVIYLTFCGKYMLNIIILSLFGDFLIRNCAYML